MLHIYSHSQHSIDERNTVGSCILHRFGNVHDAGHIGSQLYNHCLTIYLAHRSHHLSRHIGVGAEAHAPFLYIWTADIQLNRRNMLQCVNLLCHFAVFLNGGTGHIDNNIGIYILDSIIDVLTKSIHTHILQTYGIEHPRWCLCHTRVWIALPTLSGGAFHHNAAQTIQVDKIGKLFTITKRTRCSHHRILQLQIMYLDL